MIIGNSKNSPTFLREKKVEDLRSAMLRNNILYGTEFHYFDIQFAKGFWYAWYKFDFSNQLKNSGKSI